MTELPLLQCFGSHSRVALLGAAWFTVTPILKDAWRAIMDVDVAHVAGKIITVNQAAL